MITGIYKIKNIVTGKFYVGSAVDIKERWRNHKSQLRHNKHHSIKLQRSYNKHGVDNFVYEIIEECFEDVIIKREQFYIDFCSAVKNGYNCKSIAGSNLGFKHSEETKNKIRKANIGIKRSEETRIKMSESAKGKNTWSKGRILSK